MWLLPLIATGLGPALSAQAPPKTIQERLGYPVSARLLVVHADDLGMSHSVHPERRSQRTPT